jgi:MFS family permease
MSETAIGDPGVDAAGRPTRPLPTGHLARISAYWLGLTAIDSVVNLFLQFRLNYGDLVEPSQVGRTLFLVGLAGAVVGIVVQPTVGSISDYTISRWGRRKPYIVLGSLLDVVFLLGIAYSHTLIAIAAFVMLLQLSTNFARGPFQGYVPDLVAPRQVGLASALVGMMQILGNVTGVMLANIAAALSVPPNPETGQARVDMLPLALVAVAVIELVTMISVVVRVDPGLPPKPREGRSWLAIARSTWATDILRERSYMWLLASRLLFLMGGGVMFNLVITYLKQTHGLEEGEAAGVNTVLLLIVVAGNLVSNIPAARLSDRIGRKPLIYASCLIGGLGVGIAAIAPSIPIAILGGALFGVSGGIFLAVDWALMTDIIPKASAGRYMGLSNVATGASGLLATATGGLVLDAVNIAAGLGTGPRVAFLLGVVYYALAAVLLRPVREPPISERLQPEAAIV